MTGKEQLTTFYEVYERRALIEGTDGLPLLDRDTNNQKARVTAREWGGVVYKIECHVITWKPLNYEIVRKYLYYTAPDRTDPPDPFGGLDHRALRRNMNQHGRPRSRFDQRKR
jgi:hypothetical protein